MLVTTKNAKKIIEMGYPKELAFRVTNEMAIKIIKMRELSLSFKK